MLLRRREREPEFLTWWELRGRPTDAATPSNLKKQNRINYYIQYPKYHWIPFWNLFPKKHWCNMEVKNRIPSGVFSSIIADVTATQGKNNSDLSHSCIQFLDTFAFPTFEVLVVLQVIFFVDHYYFWFCNKLLKNHLDTYFYVCHLKWLLSRYLCCHFKLSMSSLFLE